MDYDNELIPWHVSNPTIPNAKVGKKVAKIYPSDSIPYKLLHIKDIVPTLWQHGVLLLLDPYKKEFSNLKAKNEVIVTIPINYIYNYYLLYEKTVMIEGNLLINGLEDNIGNPLFTYIIVLGDLIVEDYFIDIEPHCGLIVLGNVKALGFCSRYANIFIKGNLLVEEDARILTAAKNNCCTRIGSIQTKELIIDEEESIQKFNISYQKIIKQE